MTARRLSEGLYRWMVGIGVAAVLLAGCAGRNFVAGPAVPGAATWMKPSTSSEDLLYVSVSESGVVKVYTYPQGDLVGTLTGFDSPRGECVDPAGDVYIVDVTGSSESTIYEYAHGGTSPIATLSDPGAGFGCAVDPLTGKLAVTNGGDVAIYGSARGNPKLYGGLSDLAFCGYDNAGNLYFTAFQIGSSSYEVRLVRLPHGKKSFEAIDAAANLYSGRSWSPSVQWDGEHITVSTARSADGDLRTILVDRFSIVGQRGTLIGTTTLASAPRQAHLGQSWIFGDAIVGGEAFPRRHRGVAYWAYPAGGKPTGGIARIAKHSRAPFGVTISPATSR